LIATVSAALAGCGGSDPAISGSTTAGKEKHGYVVRASTTMTTASPPLDKTRFLTQVNKICREGWKEVQGNFREYMSYREPPETKREHFEETVQVSLLAGIDFHIFDQIQNLGAPPGQSGQVEELLGSLQKPVELGQLAHWHAHTLAEIPPHFRDFNRRAQQYGLKDCPVDSSNLQPISAH